MTDNTTKHEAITDSDERRVMDIRLEVVPGVHLAGTLAGFEPPHRRPARRHLHQRGRHQDDGRLCAPRTGADVDRFGLALDGARVGYGLVWSYNGSGLTGPLFVRDVSDAAQTYGADPR